MKIFWKNAEIFKDEEDYCDIKSKHKFNLKKGSILLHKKFGIQNQKSRKKGYKPRINSIEKSLPFMYIRSKHTSTVWTSGAMIFDKDATQKNGDVTHKYKLGSFGYTIQYIITV